jgi:hypothetical protein
MEDDRIWTYGFFAFIACSVITTYCVFEISKTKKRMTKILMRSGILSIFYSPCILVGHGGGIIAPVGVVYLFIINGTLTSEGYLTVALVTMIVSFLLCTAYLHWKTSPLSKQ